MGNMAKKVSVEEVGNKAAPFELIASGHIVQSPFQVRQIDDSSEGMQELVESIRVNGLCNPLTVRRLDDGTFELIAGHRRHRACVIAGINCIPCYVRDVGEAEAEALTCVENLNREDLIPIDEALTVKALLAHGRSREDVAKLTGKSVRWVYRREAAARLEQSWIEKARKHTLSSKFLEFAAALDEATREKILSNQFEGALWADGGNLAMLEKLSLVAQRNLSAAPWMGVCPEECNACLKRTDKSELVLDDSSCCLDAECWKRKMDELAERTAAKCKEKGIEVKHVTEEDLMEMDVEESRSAEYDVCVLSTTEQGAVEIYWGRSKPKAAALQKKAAVKKPTEQNVFEMAFAGEILRRVETLATSGTDLQGFLACALMTGLDLSAFRGAKTKAFVCDQRTKDVHAWMLGVLNDDTVSEPGKVFAAALQECIEQELRNRLECRNPLDTASQYALANAAVCAFGLDLADVQETVNDTIRKAKKRK